MLIKNLQFAMTEAKGRERDNMQIKKLAICNDGAKGWQGRENMQIRKFAMCNDGAKGWQGRENMQM